MNLLAAFDEQLQLLTDAGIRAAADPEDLNAPAVQLRPPTITPRFGKGGATLAWEARLMVPDNGIHNAVAAFSELIPQVQAALDWPITDMRPDVLQMPDGANLPIYVLTYTTTVRQ